MRRSKITATSASISTRVAITATTAANSDSSTSGRLALCPVAAKQ
jgi:hypothetical protein